MSRTRLPALSLFLLLPLLGGCQRSQAPGEAGADVELNGAAYHISGPYSHANVAVFLFHAADQDDRDFLTLDEGLKANLVKVSEKDQERVNELLIENPEATFAVRVAGDKLTLTNRPGAGLEQRGGARAGGVRAGGQARRARAGIAAHGGSRAAPRGLTTFARR